MSQALKKAVERVTGIGRPKPSAIVVRDRKTHAIKFQGDGQTPNNERFSFIHYKSPVKLDADYDPAAIFEELFASNGWGESWRDGVYDFLHYHTHTHEVLGIAQGSVKVQFGGRKGEIIALQTGDVVVLPAGTGHIRLSKSSDLLVIGAYPAARGGGRYNELRPQDIDYETARREIARVGIPAKDPVYGKDGGLRAIWNERRRLAR
jgi:uncharacterized protein YjlB